MYLLCVHLVIQQLILIQICMSDPGSDTQPNPPSGKLELDNLNQNNSNLFSYHNRSDRGSSSEHDNASSHEDRDQQQSPQRNKLSDMLELDEVKHPAQRDGSKQQQSQTQQGNFQSGGQNHEEQQKDQEQPNEETENCDKQIIQQKKEQKKQQEEIVKQNKQQKKQQSASVTQIPGSNSNKKELEDQHLNKVVEQVPTKQQKNLEPSNQSEQTKIQEKEIKKVSKHDSVEAKTGQPENLDHIAKQQLSQAPKSPIDQTPHEAKLANTLSEESYKKQLQQQMQILKQTKKKSDKQKQPTKNRVNKTLLPFSNPKHFQFEQTPQTKALQLKMISTMMIEKKKQNFNLLKEWDRRRADSLAIHRNMIDILQNEVDKRIKSSIQNLQIYTIFFRQKAKQEQKYVQHPIINTKYALQNNAISKNVYINCTVILNSLFDENTAKCRKINDFILVIRNDILRDSIQVHLSKSQRELLKVRQKISSLKEELRKCNSQTQQKTADLNVCFNQNVNFISDSERDFYASQIEFLRKASQQTNIQKKLGLHCLQYLQIARNQQVKRSKVIRDAMITFSKALEQCYNIETDPAEIEQLSKGQQTKLIDQFYSLEQIFDERCLTMFKSNQKIDFEKMLTVEDFDNFLKKFQFEGFDSKIILLKEYNVRYHPSSKNQANREQSCYLIITVDKFIHLFFSKQKTDVYSRPDVSIKATMKNLELKQGKGELLDIIIKDDKRNSMISYFWETKNDRTYRVQFQKRDAREEFVDYISKLRG